MFDFGQHRIGRGIKITAKQVLDRDRMHYDLAAGHCLSPTFGGRSGNESHSIQERVQAIVGPRHCAFGKDHQRTCGRFEDPNRQVNRLPIDTFAIDTESAHPANRPAHEAALLKQVPTGHRVHQAADLACQPAHYHRVSQSAVIGRQQDPVPGPQGLAQMVGTSNFVADHSFLPPQPPTGQIQIANQSGPRVTSMRRNEPVGFLDQNRLHEFTS